jgi:(S)-sulfolactate dehydrogenase
VALDELLRQADVVSLHLRLSPETAGFMDARRFAMMKPGSVLVNTARGKLVDQAALLDALRDGRIAGAALDVFHIEPLPAGDELASLPNVVMTPHVGSYIAEAAARGQATAVENIANFLKGTPTGLAVPPPAGGSQLDKA